MTLKLCDDKKAPNYFLFYIYSRNDIAVSPQFQYQSATIYILWFLLYYALFSKPYMLSEEKEFIDALIM